MKFHLEATPGELREKSKELLKALGSIFEPIDPDISNFLEKALPRKEQELKYPVLRSLQKQTTKLYEKQLDAMLADIGKVLNQSLEKAVNDGPTRTESKSEDSLRRSVEGATLPDEGIRTPVSDETGEALSAVGAGGVELHDNSGTDGLRRGPIELRRGDETELTEADGEILWKAQSHKYIRRVPYVTAKGKKSYRYYYRESAAARDVRAGETVRLGTTTVQILNVAEDGMITLKDKDGNRRTIRPSEWANVVSSHYEDYFAHAEKRARQAVNTVLNHVPQKLLEDLKGKTDKERLAELKERVPDVYDRLQKSFQRAGVNPFRAKQIISNSLERRGWSPVARAVVIGSVLTHEGAELAKNYRQVLEGAENLAGGKSVGIEHATMAIELRKSNVADIAKKAEAELTKLHTLIQAAKKGGNAEAAKVLAQVLSSPAMSQLNAISTAFPGTRDRAIEPARRTALEAVSITPSPLLKTVGAETSVFVAGEGGRAKALKAQYKLMEAKDVIPSHNPKSFRKNEAYPEKVQERAYHRDKAEQQKVMRNAQRLDAAFLVNTNPDAVNGPPIITDEGVVLGGNSRTMSMQLAYLDHKDTAAKLKKYMSDHAHEVGFTPADVEAMENPILVRVVEPQDESTEGMQLLVRQMNESFTQGMDPRTMQVAMGRKLDEKTLQSLAGSMKEDETLNAFLGTARANSFISALYKAGVIDERNTNQYMKKGTKKLNSDGKTLVSRILVGRMIADADILSDTKPKLLDSIAQSVPSMVQARGSGEGYDLSDSVSVAMDALNRLQDKVDSGVIKPLDPKISDRDLKVIMDTYFQDMFGDRHPVMDNPRAQTMLEVFIRKPGPTQMSGVFKEYAKLAAANPEGQAQLLGEKLTPERVFKISVQAAIDKEAAKEKAEASPEGPGLFEKAVELEAPADELAYDHTKPIVDKDNIAYMRVKQVITRRGFKESDFDEGGPFYGWSVNQLIDYARNKRGD